jgi:Fe-S-cluster containining protein
MTEPKVYCLVPHYAALTAKVDGFFARVLERHGDDMKCNSGCSECCHVRLTVTGVEADAIRAALATWPEERRQVLAANARASTDRCAALDPAGRCLIYEARPITCRSHGAPIRMREGSLPVIRWCHLNFTRTEPDPDCVLDQTTLSALVLAVDREASGDGSRIDLVALLS